MGDETRPIRVLHQYHVMDRGGAETWIMNVMRCMDRAAFRFDFCVSGDRPGAYDEEIRDLGGRIVPCRWRRSLPRYYRLLGRILQQGDYDVMHGHGYYFSGVTLHVAARAKVRHRFAHVHTMSDGKPTTLPRNLYRKSMLGLIRRYSTAVLGCSRAVLAGFLGPDWEQDPRTATVYYGIDLAPFEGPPDRAGVRAELGLWPDAPLIIHVGNFGEAKNPRGLINIFREMHHIRPEVHLLLVGRGALLSQTQTQVQQLGLTDRVHFLGVRSDVPRLMKAADVMLMPSIREGLPVTMIEATAAGLPVVISDMPGMREANDVCCSAKLLPVERDAREWAEAVIAALDGPRPDRTEALNRVRQSPFSSEASACTLERVYLDCVRGQRGEGARCAE